MSAPSRLAGFVLLAASFAPFQALAGEAQQPEMMGAKEMMRWTPELFVLAEILEFAPLGPSRPVRYDFVGWAGGATDRLWVKAEGEQSTRELAGSTEVQLLYGRLISAFWDLQVGARLEAGYGGELPRSPRLLGALGVQGLAPGWFEVEATLFISIRGEVSARLTSSYDLRLTQRLVLQPRLETGVAVQAVPEAAIGPGFTDIDLGARLRYEFLREVAPYVGISWERRLMESERLAAAAGQPVSRLSLVVGLRLWY